MKKLIKMLCFLLLLNSIQITAAAEQASVPKSMAEAPADLTDVSDTNSVTESTIPTKIDPNNINYKIELKKFGFLKEESKDAALNLRNAVIRFQSSCNMTVTGKWDKKCLSMLVKQLQAGMTACEDMIAAPPVSGKWITINKTKRILTLYEGEKIIQKYPVAVGNPPSRTPEDKYAIVSKVINPAWGGGGYAKPVKGGVPENPLGYRWLGLSYKNGSTLGIHGNNSPYSIGNNVSHGCIRMINSDVTQLFTVIPRSAPVWIGSEAKLKEWGIVQPEYGSKPVPLVNKTTLPADNTDNGSTPDKNTTRAGIGVESDKTAPATDGAIKVTYDEAVPTSGGAIKIAPENTGPATGGAIGIP